MSSPYPFQPKVRRASARQYPDATTQERQTTDQYSFSDDDAIYDTRLPNSARRYKPDQQPQHTQQAVANQRPRDRVVFEGEYYYRRPQAQPQRPTHQHQTRAMTRTSQPAPEAATPRFRWLFYVVLALLIMVIGWIAFTLLTNWWTTSRDDWQYGRPRTFQIDAVVGHSDSVSSPSHFIALNLRRHIEIIECPGGDCAKAKIYGGPVLLGQGQDLTPVTLCFKDVNGDNEPDMIITVMDSRFVFINENGSFRPQRPNEQVRL